jgi:hypothetical protein
MDESLANGFKNQLFREMPDRVAKLHSKLDKLLDKTKAHTKLTNWRRFANAVEPELLDIGLLSYEGGTKRKPYLGIAALDVDPKRQYNTWNEQCLECMGLLIIYDPFYFERTASSAYISEHTIKRIYQRSFDLKGFQEQSVKNHDVLKELFYVPVWAGYWSNLLFFFGKSGYAMGKVTPLIPTTNGLLFCEYSEANNFTLDVRTFVNDELLTKDQLRIKSILLKATDDAEGSPLCFLLTLAALGFDDALLEILEINSALIGELPLLAPYMSDQPDFEKHLHEFLAKEISDMQQLLTEGEANEQAQ